MATTPNKRNISFYGGHIEELACDVGGHFYYYFKNNPDLKYRFVSMESIGRICHKGRDELVSLGYDERAINFILNTDLRYGFEFYGDNFFLHYYAGGSNWPNYPTSYLAEKDRIFHAFIDEQFAFYGKK